MDKKTMAQKLAKLETINDQLLSELQYLDMLTKALGFQEGIKTLKFAAKELIKEKRAKEQPEYEEEDFS